MPSCAQHLLEGRDRAFPDLGPRGRTVAGPAHLQDNCLGRFLAGTGHVEAARGNCRNSESVPQHVVDDVIVGIIELEPAAAPGPVVSSQGQMQQLVREHEHQVVVGETGGKGRICNQAARRKYAHCRHAIVELDAHRGGETGKMRQRHRHHAQRPHDARQDGGAGRRRCRNTAHAAVTLRSRSNIARSAPSAPHFSTMSVSSVS